MKYDIIGEGSYREEESYEVMTIAELLALTVKYPEKVFRFDGTWYHPEHIRSWRGSYELPSLTYSKEEIKGKTLFSNIQEGLEKDHHGYKGGTYTYNRSQEFYVSRYGYSEEYKVVGYRVESDEVILLTKIVPH